MILSDNEKNVLKVLKHGMDKVSDAQNMLSCSKKELDSMINDSKELLGSYDVAHNTNTVTYNAAESNPRVITVKSFDELISEANEEYPHDVGFHDIFSKEEIDTNYEYIKKLNNEFDTIHKLDKIDIIIPAVAGILSGVIDCVFGGFVKDNSGRNVPGSMSEFVRKLFDKTLTSERIKKLEELSKVPYDALNYNYKGDVIVEELVDGLSPTFHHQVSLGHDPILGFVFGVLDMLRGTVSTIDFKGKFVVQFAEGYSDRKAQNLFQAISKVFLHMLSDVNGTSKSKDGGMGLPVPFMALFNELQFAKVGKNDTIAELVKSMFYQGYDFRHFCSMSIPVMITEVVVRVSYFAKRLHDGYSFKEAIPMGSNHEKKPKLGTMLFIAHTAATVINTGKVAFTKNPLNINYAQWLSFSKYSVKQLKWALADKPHLRHTYVMSAVNNHWDVLYSEIDDLWKTYTNDATIVYV